LYPSRMIDEGMVRSIFRPIGKISPVHETESLRQSVNALAQINLEAHNRNQAPYRLPANKNSIPSAMESALASITESMGGNAISYVETPRGIDPKAIISKSEAFDLRDYLQEVEGAFIRHALEDAQGSVSKAARTLGLHRTTLIEKMKKLSLEDQ
jgi:transcriptional regulator with PAS, ATPase and Fis domain